MLGPPLLSDCVLSIGVANALASLCCYHAAAGCDKGKLAMPAVQAILQQSSRGGHGSANLYLLLYPSQLDCVRHCACTARAPQSCLQLGSLISTFIIVRPIMSEQVK